MTSETLHILLSLPFTSVEENRLIEFCKVNYSIPLYANFLVLYYVNHCRYIEAIKFYNELMELPSALATKNKLGAMVDNLRLLLPEVQKNALLVHLGKRGRMIQRPLYPRVLEAQHTTQKQPQPQKQAQTQAQPQQPIANAVTSLQPQGLDVEMHSAQTSASGRER